MFHIFYWFTVWLERARGICLRNTFSVKRKIGIIWFHRENKENIDKNN